MACMDEMDFVYSFAIKFGFMHEFMSFFNFDALISWVIFFIDHLLNIITLAYELAPRDGAEGDDAMLVKEACQSCGYAHTSFELTAMAFHVQ